MFINRDVKIEKLIQTKPYRNEPNYFWIMDKTEFTNLMD